MTRPISPRASSAIAEAIDVARKRIRRCPRFQPENPTRFGTPAHFHHFSPPKGTSRFARRCLRFTSPSLAQGEIAGLAGLVGSRLVAACLCAVMPDGSVVRRPGGTLRDAPNERPSARNPEVVRLSRGSDAPNSVHCAMATITNATHVAKVRFKTPIRRTRLRTDGDVHGASASFSPVNRSNQSLMVALFHDHTLFHRAFSHRLRQRITTPGARISSSASPPQTANTGASNRNTLMASQG
jgi:hypothetical protein